MFFDNVMDQLLVLFEEKCQYPVGDSGNGVLPAADAPHQGRDTPVYIGIDMKRRGGLTPMKASHSLSVNACFPVTAGSGGIASALSGWGGISERMDSIEPLEATMSSIACSSMPPGNIFFLSDLFISCSVLDSVWFV